MPPLAVVPRPVRLESRSGRFELTEDLAISTVEPGWAAVARRLLGPGTGLELPAASEGRLALVRDPGLAEEAYVVEVRDDARFGWRGIHLDVGRHFMPLADLYRFVDLIALHKYNVFHLHLTEDQGWRFASARHPRLQEVASWRAETERRLQDSADGTPHGGFYTADQLRTVVRYAADRGVAVMPELEFPGHVRALLAAYPELGNHQEGQHATATTFGVFDE